MFNLGIWNSNWNKSIRMWPHFHFDHRSVCVNHEFAALECQDLVQNFMREFWFCFRCSNRSAPNLVMINLTNQWENSKIHKWIHHSNCRCSAFQVLFCECLYSRNLFFIYFVFKTSAATLLILRRWRTRLLKEAFCSNDNNN